MKTGPKPKTFLFRGVWLTAKQVAERSGMGVRTVYGRVSGDRILEGEDLIDPHQPHRDGAVLLTHDGQTRCVAEWARIIGINHETIRGRLNCGWTVQRALTTPLDHQRQMTRRHRNRRAIERISRASKAIALARRGITATTIVPTTMTGGYVQTFTLTPLTGGPPCETHLEGARP